MSANDTSRIAEAIGRRDWPAAERLLRRRAAKTGASAEDHYNLGAVLNELGQHRKALIPLKRAAKLAPDNPVVWLQLGGAALKTGDLALAAQGFRRAVKLDPANQMARLNAGKLALRLGEWETARTMLDGFDAPEIRALAYRAAAEAGAPEARKALEDLLSARETRGKAVSSMAKTARARIPLHLAPLGARPDEAP